MFRSVTFDELKLGDQLWTRSPAGRNAGYAIDEREAICFAAPTPVEVRGFHAGGWIRVVVLAGRHTGSRVSMSASNLARLERRATAITACATVALAQRNLGSLRSTRRSLRPSGPRRRRRRMEMTCLAWQPYVCGGPWPG